MPACGLRRGSKGGPSTAHLHQHRPKTLARGQASRGGRHGVSSGMASSGRLMRRRRGQGGVPHEVPMTQAMTTQGARRVPARAVSSFPLWCKGGKRSRGVPRRQAKVAISVQRDQDQEDYETEVTMEPKTASSPELCAGEDYFCQDSRYLLSPFKLARHCWLPSRSIFGKRTRASINRTSHPHSKGGRSAGWKQRERERKVTELLRAVHRPSQEQTLARLFFLVLFIIISPRGNPPCHTQE